MRILITTDNHVGYNETDPLRGGDSARTFDEIMQIAQEKDVDFVLQGGDLFHINKPTKQSLYDVIKTLRKRCLGDKPIEFELLHHGQLSLDAELDHANFEDPDINVAIPLFAISGNHDDRGGTVLLSPLDMLAATGLINYFGRILDNDDIQVTPLLFRKNGIKVAVYGLSNVRDERLHRAFRSGNVKFLTTPDQDSYFNILVVHQNRSAHTETNYLPETFIPGFFQLVIWGHEHECRIDPQVSPNTGFEVIQPGSSVATSLCEGEMVQKSIAILDIKSERAYEMDKVPLKTVRPFKMATVSVQKDLGIKPSKDAEKQISTWMRNRVDALISEANEEWEQANPGIEAPLPLIRLRVDYSGGYEVENPTRFSNKFSDRVANPHDVVQYTKHKESRNQSNKKIDIDFSDLSQGVEKVQLSELVHQFLEKQSLKVIPEKGMTSAISQFVDQDDKTALKEFVDLTLRTNVEAVTCKSNASVGVRSAPIVDPCGESDAEVSNIHTADVTMESDNDEIRQDLDIARSKVRTARKHTPIVEIEDSDSPVDEEMMHPPPKPKKKATPVARPKPRATKKAATKPPTSKPKPIVSVPLEDKMDSDDGFD